MSYLSHFSDFIVKVFGIADMYIHFGAKYLFFTSKIKIYGRLNWFLICKTTIFEEQNFPVEPLKLGIDIKNITSIPIYCIDSQHYIVYENNSGPTQKKIASLRTTHRFCKTTFRNNFFRAKMADETNEQTSLLLMSRIRE